MKKRGKTSKIAKKSGKNVKYRDYSNSNLIPKKKRVSREGHSINEGVNQRPSFTEASSNKSEGTGIDSGRNSAYSWLALDWITNGWFSTVSNAEKETCPIDEPQAFDESPLASSGEIDSNAKSVTMIQSLFNGLVNFDYSYFFPNKRQVSRGRHSINEGGLEDPNLKELSKRYEDYRVNQQKKEDNVKDESYIIKTQLFTLKVDENGYHIYFSNELISYLQMDLVLILTAVIIYKCATFMKRFTSGRRSLASSRMGVAGTSLKTRQRKPKEKKLRSVVSQTEDFRPKSCDVAIQTLTNSVKKISSDMGIQTVCNLVSSEIGIQTICETVQKSISDMGMQTICDTVQKSISDMGMQTICNLVSSDMGIQTICDTVQKSASDMGIQTMQDFVKKSNSEIGTQATPKVVKKTTSEMGTQAIPDFVKKFTSEMGIQTVQQAVKQASSDMAIQAIEDFVKEISDHPALKPVKASLYHLLAIYKIDRRASSSEMAISSVKRTCDSAAQTTFTDKLQCCKSSADHAVKLNKNYNNNHLANLNKK